MSIMTLQAGRGGGRVANLGGGISQSHMITELTLPGAPRAVSRVLDPSLGKTWFWSFPDLLVSSPCSLVVLLARGLTLISLLLCSSISQHKLNSLSHFSWVQEKSFLWICVSSLHLDATLLFFPFSSLTSGLPVLTWIPRTVPPLS